MSNVNLQSCEVAFCKVCRNYHPVLGRNGKCHGKAENFRRNAIAKSPRYALPETGRNGGHAGDIGFIFITAGA